MFKNVWFPALAVYSYFSIGVLSCLVHRTSLGFKFLAGPLLSLHQLLSILHYPIPFLCPVLNVFPPGDEGMRVVLLFLFFLFANALVMSRNIQQDKRTCPSAPCTLLSCFFFSFHIDNGIRMAMIKQ